MTSNATKFAFTAPDLEAKVFSQRGFGTLKDSVKGLFLNFRSPLSDVESRVSSRLTSDVTTLVDVSAYLLTLGGKRIRPLLALASGKLFGLKTSTPQLIDVAAGIELIHMATLLHDDIIDCTPVRRHKPSALTVYGEPATLLTGDFLLVRAFGLCAHLGDFIIEATEKACVELTEGETLEGHLTPDSKNTIDSYITVVEKKTASLFWLASVVGAHLAETTSENVARMGRFGRYAGITFQMVDDILDVVADQELLGKPVGTDLKQQTPSLVNILWLASGDPEAAKFFSLKNPSQAECDKAAAYLRESSIINECREMAFGYVEKAKSELANISSPNLDATVQNQLKTLVEYTFDRCF